MVWLGSTHTSFLTKSFNRKPSLPLHKKESVLLPDKFHTLGPKLRAVVRIWVQQQSVCRIGRISPSPYDTAPDITIFALAIMLLAQISGTETCPNTWDTFQCPKPAFDTWITIFRTEIHAILRNSLCINQDVSKFTFSFCTLDPQFTHSQSCLWIQ